MGTPRQVNPPNTNIILFDGVCNLCSASVQFIIKRDPKSVFQFAALQSTTGQQLLDHFHIDKNKLHSIILVRGNYFYQRSDAALEIARKLRGVWPLLYTFKILPRFMRDAVYDWISSRRYRFFGKQEACWIPTPDLKSRFID